MRSIGYSKRLFAVAVFLAAIALAVGCGTAVEKASKTNGSSDYYYHLKPGEVPIGEKEMLEERRQTFDTVQEANSAAPLELRGKVREPGDTLGGSPDEIYIPKQRGELAPRVITIYSNDILVSIEYKERKQDYKAMAEYMRGLDEQGYGKHSSQVYPVKVAGYDGIALEPGFNLSTWGGEKEPYAGYLKWQDEDNIEYFIAGDLSGDLGVEELMQVANSMY